VNIIFFKSLREGKQNTFYIRVVEKGDGRNEGSCKNLPENVL